MACHYCENPVFDDNFVANGMGTFHLDCWEEFQVEYDNAFPADDADSEYSESMDGDHDSCMRDCGWGTDEDYGYFGGEDF